MAVDKVVAETMVTEGKPRVEEVVYTVDHTEIVPTPVPNVITPLKDSWI